MFQPVLNSCILGDVVSLARAYSVAYPFPHIVIDNFFEKAVADMLALKVNALQTLPVAFHSVAQKKKTISNLRAYPEAVAVFNRLMGSEILAWLETVSNTEGLRTDERFAAAGFHRYEDGGFSEIHLDASHNPFDGNLYRRLALIVYLNRQWRTDWGGELILWSADNERPAEPARTIASLFNRAVIFSESKTSWHSVSSVRCPIGQARNSLMLYYYTFASTADEESVARSNIWHSKRAWHIRVMLQLSNRAIMMAKPYARYLRWIRPNKFDAAY